MKKTILLFALLLTFINVSCVKEHLGPMPHDSVLSVKSSQEEYTTSYDGKIVLGKKMPNPYALANMQMAYDSLMKTVSPTPVKLSPTELYVRFLPKDSTDLRLLWEDDALVLFDYPLDYEIATEGSYYHDPDIPEDMPTWLYTAVPVDYVFPDVEYEILEECYIPDDGKSRASETSSVSAEDLERMAYKLVGLEDQLQQEQEGGKTKLWKNTPIGTFEFVSDTSGTIVPIKGTKVVAHNFVKIATGYTTDYGDYILSKSFWTRVRYLLVFENRKDFTMRYDYKFILPVACHFGGGPNTGIDRRLTKDDKTWPLAVINNAVYDYYEICQQKDIALPPKDLKIWVFSSMSNSSAPMLNKVDVPIGVAYNSFWSTFFINILMMPITDILLKIIDDLLCLDITFGIETIKANYTELYKVVFHELSHASHFSQVGDEYWADYIGYIVTYGAYGDGTGKNAGVCEVGEMWGYAMEQVHYYKNFQERKLSGEYPVRHGSSIWFKPQIYWDLIRDGFVTEKQLFGYMTNDVRDLSALKEKIYSNTDKSKLDIAEIFSKYKKNDGKIQWVIKNSTCEDLLLYVSSPQFPVGKPNPEEVTIPVNPSNPDTALIVSPGVSFGGPITGGDPITKNGYDEAPFDIGQEYTIAEFPDFYLSCSELIGYDEIRPNTIIIFDKRGETLKKVTEGSTDYEKFFSESLWHKTQSDSLIQYAIEITEEILNAN